MHYAVSHGNFDVVSILLDSKVCNINNTNNAGYTCVMLVSLATLDVAEHQTVVQRLFQIADVNVRAKKHSQTALVSFFEFRLEQIEKRHILIKWCLFRCWPHRMAISIWFVCCSMLAPISISKMKTVAQRWCVPLNTAAWISSKFYWRIQIAIQPFRIW